MTVTLHVCTTCKMGRPIPDDAPRPGARLLSALTAAGAPDGLVPWRERPVIFRKQSLARIPPMES